MVNQSNKKIYTLEKNPFAYYKRYWQKYYANKTYQTVTISNYVNKIINKRLVQELGIRVPQLFIQVIMITVRNLF
jgi:hypothetical protein